MGGGGRGEITAGNYPTEDLQYCIIVQPLSKGGHANYFCLSANRNPQILGLIPQSQIGKFLKCASPQIASPKNCND